MITKYSDFILEKIDFNLQDETFWDDYNDMLKKRLNRQYDVLTEFCQKYFDIMDEEKIDGISDMLADHHNYGRVPKKITLGEQLYILARFIDDIYIFYQKEDSTLANKLFENPLKFIKEEKIKIYRGQSNYSPDSNESTEGKMKSFTLDKDIAIRFTQRNWVHRAFVDDRLMNGRIVEAEITLQDIYLFNNVGGELECVLKKNLKYTKNYVVENGKIVKDIEVK